MSLVRPLDRYVFTEWAKIFLATAIGFPLLLVVIDLTDHLQKYLDQNLPRADIALSYENPHLPGSLPAAYKRPDQASRKVVRLLRAP